MDLLLARGVRVHVLHVVTPDNEDETAEFLEEKQGRVIRHKKPQSNSLSLDADT